MLPVPFPFRSPRIAVGMRPAVMDGDGEDARKPREAAALPGARRVAENALPLECPCPAPRSRHPSER